jgi:DNA-binding NtrC family response regulator
MIKATVLIVEGNSNDLRELRSVIGKEAEKIIAVNSPNRIYEMLDRNQIDIILLGMNFSAGIRSGNEGLFWLGEITRTDSTLSVIMITDNGEIGQAIQAIRKGAADYIPKPWQSSKLVAAVNVAWQLRLSRLETSRLKQDKNILMEEINRGGERIVLGASPTMINVMNIVKKAAPTDANILITGENGTGKELVAREIHRLSSRARQIMVSVDMGSITESLFESELFGHVKGAFTDAREDRAGKFEIAHNSTLFLDEIGNLSLQSQAKLLSALQSRHIVRVGSNRQVPVNIRLICATNCNLDEMVLRGKFRQDLLYRINTILIEVPPLRDRVDDIPILANYFLKVNAERYGKEGMKLNTHSMEKLANYDWPGNVRELQHSIEKAVILSDSMLLKPTDFAFSSSTIHGKAGQSEMTLEESEKKLIYDTIRKHNNNLSVVAGKLGITRQTLYNKIRKYGL